jgi:hypothetical protein
LNFGLVERPAIEPHFIQLSLERCGGAETPQPQIHFRIVEVGGSDIAAPTT